MKFYKTICIACCIAMASFFNPLYAQEGKDPKDAEANYTNVINQRANKIVAAIGIADSSKFYKVQDIIVQQYRNLRTVHDNSNTLAAAAKQTGNSKEIIAEAVKRIEDDRTSQLDKFHEQYISKLTAQLTADQVTAIKDGMTYNILPITYKAYQEMLPALTAGQKKQIYDYLVEAREHAIDAESSDKKHAWFGKYKGKINNYLSAQGIDMKKAGDEWQARIKAKKTD